MAATIEIDFTVIEPERLWEHLGIDPMQARAKPISWPVHQVTIEGVTQEEADAAVLSCPRGTHPSQVKAEAQRRIIALTGASDIMNCLIKQHNASMRAIELNDKRLSNGALTAQEEAEAQALRDLAAAIKAIRAASNVLEAMAPIPADYESDTYWL